ARALPARHARSDRHAPRLRHDVVRGVHGAARRHAGEVVHGLGSAGHGTRGHDGRRPADGRRSASDPAGVPRGARPAVRLLYAGDDADSDRVPEGEPEADGRGDPLGALREHLPLHGLPEHRQGGAQRRRQARGRGEGAMATTEIRGIGHSVERKEDDRFIRGAGHYVDDVKLPGMLHMELLRSPIAHARIKSIDTSRAAAVPGVIAVVTGELMAAHNLAWMPTLSGDTQAVLATDKVRFQGQEVAAVVAETPYVARDAVDLIEVDYELLPAITSPQQALEDGAPVIRDEKEGQTDNRIFHWEAGDKDATDRAFADADKVVALDTFYPRCHPAPLECCGCVADVNPATGQATIYMTSQAPHAHRTLFALVAGLPEQK